MKNCWDHEISLKRGSLKRGSAAVSAASTQRAPSLRTSSILYTVVKIDQHSAFHVDTVSTSKEEIQAPPLHEVLASMNFYLAKHNPASHRNSLSSKDFQPRMFVKRMGRKTATSAEPLGRTRRVSRSLLVDTPRRDPLTPDVSNARSWIELQKQMMIGGGQEVNSDTTSESGLATSNLHKCMTTTSGQPSLIIITSKSPRYDPQDYNLSASTAEKPIFADKIHIQDMPSQESSSEVTPSAPKSPLELNGALESTRWLIPSLEELLLNPGVEQRHQHEAQRVVEKAPSALPDTSSDVLHQQRPPTDPTAKKGHHRSHSQQSTRPAKWLSFASGSVTCREIKRCNHPLDLYNLVKSRVLEMDAVALSTALDCYADLASSARNLSLEKEMETELLHLLCEHLAPIAAKDLGPVGVRTTLWALATVKAMTLAQEADKKLKLSLAPDEIRTSLTGRGTHFVLRPSMDRHQAHSHYSRDPEPENQQAVWMAAFRGGVKRSVLRSKSRAETSNKGGRREVASRGAITYREDDGTGDEDDDEGGSGRSTSTTSSPDYDSVDRYGQGHAHNGGYTSSLIQDGFGRRRATMQGLTSEVVSGSSDSRHDLVTPANDDLDPEKEKEEDEARDSSIPRQSSSQYCAVSKRLSVTQSVRLLLQQLQENLLHNMDDFGHNGMAMCVWSLVLLKSPGRHEVLCALGKRIATQGWLETAKATDTAHLLWSYAEDRSDWSQHLSQESAMKLIRGFTDNMSHDPDRFHVNDLCRGLHSLQTFTRNPMRGFIHKIIQSICRRAHHMLPLNFVQLYMVLSRWQLQVKNDSIGFKQEESHSNQQEPPSPVREPLSSTQNLAIQFDEGSWANRDHDQPVVLGCHGLQPAVLGCHGLQPAVFAAVAAPATDDLNGAVVAAPATDDLNGQQTANNDRNCSTTLASGSSNYDGQYKAPKHQPYVHAPQYIYLSQLRILEDALVELVNLSQQRNNRRNHEGDKNKVSAGGSHRVKQSVGNIWSTTNDIVVNAHSSAKRSRKTWKLYQNPKFRPDELATLLLGMSLMTSPPREETVQVLVSALVPQLLDCPLDRLLRLTMALVKLKSEPVTLLLEGTKGWSRSYVKNMPSLRMERAAYCFAKMFTHASLRSDKWNRLQELFSWMLAEVSRRLRLSQEFSSTYTTSPIRPGHCSLSISSTMLSSAGFPVSTGSKVEQPALTASPLQGKQGFGKKEELLAVAVQVQQPTLLSHQAAKAPATQLPIPQQPTGPLLARMIMAASKLGVSPEPEFMHMAYSKLATSLHTLQPSTLAQMSWALGHLKYRPPPRLIEELKREAEKYCTLNMCSQEQCCPRTLAVQIVWALEVLGYSDVQLVKKVCQAVWKTSFSLRPRHVASLSWVVARRLPAAHKFLILMARVACRFWRHFSVKSMIMMLIALSSSKVPPHRYTAFLEAARFWLMANISNIRQARHLRLMLHCFRSADFSLEGVFEEVVFRLQVMDEEEVRQKLDWEERQILRKAAKSKGQKKAVQTVQTRDGVKKVIRIVDGKPVSAPVQDAAVDLEKSPSRLSKDDKEQGFSMAVDDNTVKKSQNAAPALTIPAEGFPSAYSNKDSNHTLCNSKPLSRLSQLLVRPIHARRQTGSL